MGVLFVAIGILIGLVIWIWLTVLATNGARKWAKKIFPQKKWAGTVGAFLGFMLLMGWAITYCLVEYIQTQRYAEQECKKVGITIYITPEQWKEMVGGEEAWKAMPSKQQSLYSKPPYPDSIFFDKKIYEISTQYNERIISYRHDYRKFKRYTSELIYYDVMTNSVLFRQIISTGFRSIRDLSDLDFWHMSSDCPNNDWSSDIDRKYIANY